ncbi:DUF2085 domain-containing protein [Oscillospiraceae bacterium CLA-AA-H269]|nr:DUF2085 domain-containing protein [Hominicoprocola fusiformis]
MSFGKHAGCHQRPDRSFFINGHQFPVCARCTGVLIGQCSALILYRILSLPAVILVSFCAVMFLDWLLQYLDILESTNWRRLITGTFCGYALCTFFLRLLVRCKFLISHQNII